MNTTCKNCGAGLEVDDDLRGQIATCPGCETMFEVPMIGRNESAPATIMPPAFQPLTQAPSRLELKPNSIVRGGAVHQSRRGSGGNVVAALASFFIPGLGQLTQGRMTEAAFFFLLSACCGVAGMIFLEFPISLFPQGLVAIGAAAEAALWDGRA